MNNQFQMILFYIAEVIMNQLFTFKASNFGLLELPVSLFIIDSDFVPELYFTTSSQIAEPVLQSLDFQTYLVWHC
ncbi:MAG: hypothetical protein ACLRPQ_01755 [Streptococcus sp.]